MFAGTVIPQFNPSSQKSTRHPGRPNFYDLNFNERSEYKIEVPWGEKSEIADASSFNHLNLKIQ
jgi:hypothetical protein